MSIDTYTHLLYQETESIIPAWLFAEETFTSEACPSCLESFDEISKASKSIFAHKVTHLLHPICEPCLHLLIKSNQTVACPICRERITSIQGQDPRAWLSRNFATPTSSNKILISLTYNIKQLCSPYRISAISRSRDEYLESIATLLESPLLGQHPPCPDELLCLPALAGDLEMVQLLASKFHISQSERGVALRLAASNDYQNIVEFLVSNGPIYSEDYQKAIKISLNLRYYQIAHFLQRNSPR